MNKDKLVGLMLLNGDTPEMLSAAIGCEKSTLSRKLNGYKGAEFTQGEIASIKERYKLSARQLDEIFFAPTVS